MIRRRIGAIALVMLLLTGCGWMDGSYVSVTPHQVVPNRGGEGNARAVSGYMELRDALIALVNEGQEKGLFSLAEYPGEAVQADMKRAVAYVTGTYPVGAYAVEKIDYNVGAGLGTNAMSVSITYSHGRAELADIRTVRWISGAEAAIADAVDECADKLVLQISGYRDVDFPELVRKYAMENPDRVMECPSVTARSWPERGDTRVVELLFHYRTDRQTLRTMREQVQPVFRSAALYVTGQAEERVKFQQLHAFLTERFDNYTLQRSVTPSYALLCEGVGDSEAFSQVYAAMCRSIDLEAVCISGRKDGRVHHWNLVCIDDVWYHLDLMASGSFLVKTDEDMAGYEWDPAAVPAT